MPQPAFAHASERAFVLLMPTGAVMMAGTIVVAATFLLLALLPGRIASGWSKARVPLFRLPSIPPEIPSCVSFLLLLALIWAGFWGTRNPLENPLPLTIWTLWWVGFVLLQALFGDLWSRINPWVGPNRFARQLLGRNGHGGLFDYPLWLGHVPAILLFLAFAWLEIVDLAPADPARLAFFVSVYVAITFLGMAIFGERAWLAHGEPFTIFLGYVARLSPFQVEDGKLSLVLPGSRLASGEPLTISAALFVLLTLATVTYDGFCHTHFWLAANGINPLEFPGRSAVQGINTAGLAGAWMLLVALYSAAVLLGLALSRTTNDWRRVLGLHVLAILPISIGYHFAHYLTALLVNGQYLLHILGDFQVTTSFLNDYYSVRLIWALQAGAIVVCHMLAFAVSHAAAARHGQAGFLAQLPLAVLMVAYTMLGLWLLATPIVS